MIRDRFVLWLLVATTACSYAPQQSPKPLPSEVRTGLIAGTVTYEDGKPVKGATVDATPLGRPMIAITPHADTDASGHFAIHIPRSWFGKFAVTAKKETEDYPDTSMQFYSDGKFETATLTSTHPSATVTIQLGPKAGVLLGTISDALTGSPLSPCVKLKRAAEPNNFLSASGLVKAKYKLLIPSDAGILIEISLDGYRPWYYPGTAEKSAAQAILLKPGEEKNVDIRLRPDPAAGNTGCPQPLASTAASQ